jgi:hypothetical protein
MWSLTSARFLLHACFLLGIFFDPEDEDSTLLRKVHGIERPAQVIAQKKWLFIHESGNLKSGLKILAYGRMRFHSRCELQRLSIDVDDSFGVRRQFSTSYTLRAFHFFVLEFCQHFLPIVLFD